MDDFEFFEPGELRDNDLALVLVKTTPANPSIGFVPAYLFRMENESQDEVGEIHLRVGSNSELEMYSGHLGYKVNREYRGHKYAARSITLLRPLMRKHGLETIWITADPANIASRRTCELAGAEFVEIVDLPEGIDLYERGFRKGCRYRLQI